MTDKKPHSSPETEAHPDANRRRMLLRGGAVAGGLAAFAAGYGETVAKGAKGLVQGTSGVTTKSATRGNSLTPEFRIEDRKSTRLNSSHVKISYAVFCLKKK